MQPIFLYPESYKFIVDFSWGVFGGIAKWCEQWYLVKNKAIIAKNWNGGIDLGIVIYAFLGGFSGVIVGLLPSWFIDGNGACLIAGYSFSRVMEKLNNFTGLIKGNNESKNP